ncbi:jg16932 [Pararge aegeria aegeria]|uniref:Jg16932 protein n=1 Tax=Pararge aegeria aegeria TaxID=348720 RepID=A0A8S4SMK0_9NEOP|nr:jg16932 [Pararge aegeria aegeria]
MCVKVWFRVSVERLDVSVAKLTFMSRSGEEEPLPLMAGREAGACHSLTALARRGAGGAGGLRTPSDRDCRTPAPTVPRAPTATGCLISHYNLRARFLPSLLPRFVLRIIECIPLAPRPPCALSAAQIIAVCNYALAARPRPGPIPPSWGLATSRDERPQPIREVESL